MTVTHHASRSIADTIVDFASFLEQDKDLIVEVMVGLLDKESVIAFFETVREVLKWFYEQLNTIEAGLISLDSAFALMESIGRVITFLQTDLQSLAQRSIDSEKKMLNSSNGLGELMNSIPSITGTDQLEDFVRNFPSAEDIHFLKQTIPRVTTKGLSGLPGNGIVDEIINELTQSIT